MPFLRLICITAGAFLAGAAGHYAAIGRGHPLLLALAAIALLAISLGRFRDVSIWRYLGIAIGGLLGATCGAIGEAHVAASLGVAALAGGFVSASVVPHAFGLAKRKRRDA